MKKVLYVFLRLRVTSIFAFASFFFSFIGNDGDKMWEEIVLLTRDIFSTSHRSAAAPVNQSLLAVQFFVPIRVGNLWAPSPEVYPAIICIELQAVLFFQPFSCFKKSQDEDCCYRLISCWFKPYNNDQNVLQSFIFIHEVVSSLIFGEFTGHVTTPSFILGM